MGYKEMALAYQAEGLTDGEALVLVAVVYHANIKHGDSTFIGQATLGEEMGKPRTSINKALRALEGRGYITRNSRPNASRTGRGTGLLTVHYDAIEQAIRDAGRVPAEGTSVSEQRQTPKGKRAESEQFSDGTVPDPEGKRAESAQGNVLNRNWKRAESAHVTGNEPGREPVHQHVRPGAPPPAHAHASSARAGSDDASYLEWGTEPVAAEQADTEDWKTSTADAGPTLPEPAPATPPAQPMTTQAATQEIGPGRAALRQHLASLKTDTPTR